MLADGMADAEVVKQLTGRLSREAATGQELAAEQIRQAYSYFSTLITPASQDF